MKSKFKLPLLAALLLATNAWAQTVESDLRTEENGLIKPTFLDQFYTDQTNRIPIPRYHEYFDLSVLFNTKPSDITFYSNGKIACSTCSNNISYGFTDQIMYSADKAVINNPGQCDQSVSTSRVAKINPARLVSSSTNEKVENDQFFYDTVYKCTRPNFLKYSENRLTVDSSSKIGGKSVKGQGNTCVAGFDGNTAYVQFGKFSWKLNSKDWRIKVTELVDFKDSSESMSQLPWVYETNAFENKAKMKDIDQTLVYWFQPSHAMNPQVSEVRGFTEKPFRLLYADFVRNALVAVRLFEPETGTELSCALKKGQSGFNDLVQFRVHQRP